jgi:hypothetical protein
MKASCPTPTAIGEYGDANGIAIATGVNANVWSPRRSRPWTHESARPTRARSLCRAKLIGRCAIASRSLVDRSRP